MDAKTIGAIVVRHALTTIAGVLAARGVIQGGMTELFISAGMLAAGTAWSFWEKYGRDIALAHLEIWRLKALDRRAALIKAGAPVPPPPTAARVDMATPASVTTAMATKAVATAAGMEDAAAKNR